MASGDCREGVIVDAGSEFRLQIESREKNVLRIVERRPKVWYTEIPCKRVDCKEIPSSSKKGLIRTLLQIPTPRVKTVPVDVQETGIGVRLRGS